VCPVRSLVDACRGLVAGIPGPHIVLGGLPTLPGSLLNVGLVLGSEVPAGRPGGKMAQIDRKSRKSPHLGEYP
jgi:hypothetical protein